VWPQLERLVAQCGELDLRAVGEPMLLSDGHSHDLAPDCSLSNVFGIRRQRRESEVAVAVAQEGGDVAAEDLAGVDLQQRIVTLESFEE
jgi:hypothetical protein